MFNFSLNCQQIFFVNVCLCAFSNLICCNLLVTSVGINSNVYDMQIC